MIQRPRRLRQNPQLRSLVRENKVSVDDLIYPIFIKEGEGVKEAVSSMPGIYRWSLDLLVGELEEIVNLGIKAIALFPVIDQSLKDLEAKESYNPEGLTQKAIRLIKKNFPNLLLVSDVALDPYTSHGHDGILGDCKREQMSLFEHPDKELKVLNDRTVEVLVRMALAQAEAGVDIVAPSDMMDGRIGAIREALDKNGFEDVCIMSYAAKYASCLYGPFRDALGSLGAKEAEQKSTAKKAKFIETSSQAAGSEAQELDPVSCNVGLAMKEKLNADDIEPSGLLEKIPEDKSTYQMDPANSEEALKELELDVAEGADFVMVKPASWYLDIIFRFKSQTNLPVAAYQVSGEYSMIRCAAENGLIDLDKAMNESLLAIKRAGADMILTYFAKDFAKQ